jgi:hypothetical protein
MVFLLTWVERFRVQRSGLENTHQTLIKRILSSSFLEGLFTQGVMLGIKDLDQYSKQFQEVVTSEP